MPNDDDTYNELLTARWQELSRSLRIRQEMMALDVLGCEMTEEEYQARLKRLKDAQG